MAALKQILDDVSLAIGLGINFHKSTFVPMHIPEGTATDMAEVLAIPFPVSLKAILDSRFSPTRQESLIFNLSYSRLTAT